MRLASIASDPLGKTGRAIIDALMVGEQTPGQIADVACRRLRAKREDIARAVEGVLSDTTRFLLRQMIEHVDQVAVAVANIDARIADVLTSMSAERDLLTGIPGINPVTAAGVLAETGGNMSVFPSADHLVSWAGLAPGSHESAGKHKAVSTRKGSHWVRLYLVQSAWAATRAKGTFWKRKFERLRATRSAAGPDRHRAQDDGGDLPHPVDPDSVPGARRRARRERGPPAARTQARQAATDAGVPGPANSAGAEPGVTAFSEQELLTARPRVVGT